VLTIRYEKLLEIHFQNPPFGYYFLVLTSQRLVEKISRLEGIIAQTKSRSGLQPRAARTERFLGTEIIGPSGYFSFTPPRCGPRRAGP
jgi:hypothetical protein